METMESVEGSVLLRSALFILFVSLSPSLVIPLSEKTDKLVAFDFNITTSLSLLTSLNVHAPALTLVYSLLTLTTLFLLTL